MKNVDLIVDMQFGSTGKGLIAGYLAKKHKYDVVVNANMPNAGHTFIDSTGNVMIHKVLPSGIVSPKIKYVLIGPGSVFRWGRLYDEVQAAQSMGYMTHAKVLIHPMAVPLNDRHKRGEETSGLTAIGSTKQGSAMAMVDKMLRDVSLNIVARDVIKARGNIRVAGDTEYNHVLKSATRILAEGAQGFSLGINEQFYPYCTSRDCGPARFLSDMGIPLHMLNKIIGTARTYPIRVGGTSGGCYDDQREIKWGDIGVDPETTTVTGRERRVFTFSRKQIQDASWAMSIDEVFLNFCNYMNGPGALEELVEEFLVPVKYFGFGPAEGDVHENEI